MTRTRLRARGASAWIVACGVVAAAAAAGAPASTVATVGRLSIRQSELDERATEMQRAFEQRRGEALSGQLRLMVRRQALAARRRPSSTR